MLVSKFFMDIPNPNGQCSPSGSCRSCPAVPIEDTKITIFNLNLFCIITENKFRQYVGDPISIYHTIIFFNSFLFFPIYFSVFLCFVEQSNFFDYLLTEHA